MALAAEALLRLRAVFDDDGIKRAQRAIAGMETAASGAKRSFKNVLDSSAWQGAAVAATGIGAGLVYSAKKAIELESQMVQVRKVVEFDSPNGLRKLQDDLVGLSTKIPYTAKELAELAAAAGMAGYAEKDILKFVEASAKMGTAFNISASEAGDAMVSFQAAMGLSLDEAIKLGDAINHLSDNMKGVVEPAALVEVTKRIGAIGVAAGLSAKDVAALGAAFLAPGTKAEVAATGLKNFLKAMTQGEAGSKSFRQAMDRLMGMPNAAQFVAKQMQIDPKGTIMKVIEQLRKVPKEFQAGLISDIFGEESKAAIQPLLTNTKLLSDAFGLVAGDAKFAGSMTKEFNNQLNSSEAQLKLFKNNIDAIAISLGNALLPGVNAILAVLKPFLSVLGFLAQKVPGFSAAVVGLGAAFAGLVISAPFISSLMTIATALRGMSILSTIGGWLGAVVPWLTRLAPLFTALGPAILTVGRIILGIFSGPVGWATLLISAGIALYAFRDKVAQFFAWMAPAVATAGVAIRQGWGMFTSWLGTSLVGAIAIMRQGWSAFSIWMSTTLTSVGSALAAGLASISTGFNLYAIQPIRAAFAPLLIWIGQTIQAWSLAWWNYVTSGFNLYVITPIRNGWQFLVTGMQVIWTGLVTWLGQSIAFVQQLFSTIWAQVSTSFNAFVISPLQIGWNTLIVFFQQGLAAIRNWFITAWTGLSQSFYLGVTQPIQQMWGGFVQWLGGTIGNVRAFLGPMWNGLAQGFSLQIVQPLGGAWNALMGGIRSAWSGMVQALSNSARGIAGALSSAFGSVIQGVRSAFQGLINWVTSAVNTLKNLANGVIDRYNASAGKVGAPPISKFAKGGYVNGPTLAWVGEGGDSEYIIPSRKMAGAAQAYLAGARGPSVLNAANSIRGFAKGGFVQGRGSIGGNAPKLGDFKYQLGTDGQLYMVQKGGNVRAAQFGSITINGKTLFGDDKNYSKKLAAMAAAAGIKKLTGRSSGSTPSAIAGGGRSGGGGSTRFKRPRPEQRRNVVRYTFMGQTFEKVLQPGESFSPFGRQGPDYLGIGGLDLFSRVKRPPIGFARGGFVTRPTLGWIGEGNDSEYIIPSRRMAASSMAYLAGARGMGVVNPPRFANGGLVGPIQNRSANLDGLINRTSSVGLNTAPVKVGDTTIVVQTGDIRQDPDGEQWVRVSDYEKGLAQVQRETMALLRTAAGRRATGRR